MLNINKNLANKIVESIKEVCGYDINFIDSNGIIIASTNINRISSFHEAGFSAIKNSKIVVVSDDKEFLGAKNGINVPIYVNEIPICAIGATGNPEDVSKYVFLLSKITEIFLNENILKESLSNKSNQINYIVQTYIYNQTEKFIYTGKILKEFNIDTSIDYCAIVITLNTRYNLKNLNLIEKDIKEFFTSFSCNLNGYIYPFEFIGILPKSQLDILHKKLNIFASSYKNILKIGIGSTSKLENLNISYNNAKTALKYIDKNSMFKYFEDYSLEILLNSIPSTMKNSYLEKFLCNISKEEIELLSIYFNNNMQLKKTSSDLFIHINTLQYRLDKIFKNTNLNPRVFKDACLLNTFLNLI